MKTEIQIKNFLARCYKVRDFGMSKGKCPAEKGRRKGCCAECSMPSTLLWVLGKDVKASANMQDVLIEALRGKEVR
ncbi:MAG: hypothetical protein KKD77_24340 [Gammaproteobacteria bacterium]|nr:hypothetical protein [Gammaproteobacteria bacterium]